MMCRVVLASVASPISTCEFDVFVIFVQTQKGRRFKRRSQEVEAVGEADVRVLVEGLTHEERDLVGVLTRRRHADRSRPCVCVCVCVRVCVRVRVRVLAVSQSRG